ncbi:lantibiotic dehydratase [Streptomyces mayteni]
MLAARLRALADEGLVREAVALSSPSLARGLDLLGNSQSGGGGVQKLTDLRQAVRALSRYRLRMAGRPTPFGLLAGVAAAEFTDARAWAGIRFGSAHRRVPRVDCRWLLGLLAAWELRPEVLRQLRLTANNLCHLRGKRLVLTYQPDHAVTSRAGGTARTVSIRFSGAVRAALDHARVPVDGATLERRLRSAFPTADENVVRDLVMRLVEKGFLLTELQPPSSAVDPLEHVLEVLARLPNPTELPELPELRAIQQDLANYAAKPLGEGSAALAAVSGRMRRLRQAEAVVHVDLAMDIDVRLPQAVAREAEDAARTLWRLSPRPPGSKHLRQYHLDFLERYGVERPVGLRELLDPSTGLGPPAGYRRPQSNRALRVEPDDHPERDRLLLSLAQQATVTGAPEVVLTEGPGSLIAQLACDDGVPPDSLDVHLQVLASSPGALWDGDFRLVVLGGAIPAGAMSGRFAHLLPDDFRAVACRSSDEHSNNDAGEPGFWDRRALPAQVVCQPATPRAANVVRVPRVHPNWLPVGVFADRKQDQTLDLERLAVAADTTRLFFIDTRDGCEVAPAGLHMLDMVHHAPNMARFLHELPYSGVRLWEPWDWGAAAGLPFLPRVRYRRTVLTPARWRLPDTMHDQTVPLAAWSTELVGWRECWHVPRQVRVSHFDQRLDLDLTDPHHLRLLRHEMRRCPDLEVFEALDDAQTESWLAGPDGHHTNELVLPLVTRKSERRIGRTASRPMAPLRDVRHEQLPGGEWLYASLYCATDQENELLIDHLPQLLAMLPYGPDGIDRWFFIRYGGADDRHLRLRFHAKPEVIVADGLRRLHEWAARLLHQRVIRRLTLDTYDPELERYGGPDAMEAAERVFHADSRSVLAQLRRLETSRTAVAPMVAAAANYINIAAAFWPTTDHGQEPAWTRWFLSAFPRESRRPEALREYRGALSLIDPSDDWAALRALPNGAALVGAWSERAEALATYGQLLHRQGKSAPSTASDVLLSLLHMHHNRLVGGNQKAEETSYALASAAVQALVNRRRHLARVAGVRAET